MLGWLIFKIRLEIRKPKLEDRPPTLISRRIQNQDQAKEYRRKTDAWSEGDAGLQDKFGGLKGNSTTMQGKGQDSRGAASPAAWLNNLPLGILLSAGGL